MSGEAPAMWSGVFTVEGYSQTKGILGIGNSFNSNVFFVGGYGWRIEYYPDGYTQANADCIGFGLGLDRPPDAADDEKEDVVKAQFSFALLDEDGAPVPACTAESGVCSFSVRKPSWVLERFVERRDLESSPYLGHDDSFSIRCSVTVYTPNGNAAAIAVPVALTFAAMDDEVEEDVTMVMGVDNKMMAEHNSTVVASPQLVGIDEIYRTTA
jgi:speckle-type POZ protein